MKHPIFKSEVRDKTKALLAEYLKYKENTFAKISNDTGLSETWISMFARNKLKHTDIGRVETLYNYLSPLRLEA